VESVRGIKAKGGSDLIGTGSSTPDFGTARARARG